MSWDAPLHVILCSQHNIVVSFTLVFWTKLQTNIIHKNAALCCQHLDPVQPVSCLSLSTRTVSTNRRHSRTFVLQTPTFLPSLPPRPISISHSPLLLSQPLPLYRIYTSHMLYLASSFPNSFFPFLSSSPHFFLSRAIISADLSNQHSKPPFLSSTAHTQPISTLILPIPRLYPLPLPFTYMLSQIRVVNTGMEAAARREHATTRGLRERKSTRQQLSLDPPSLSM